MGFEEKNFQSYIFNRIKNQKNSVLRCNLRPLNSMYNEIFEQSINSTKIDILNLEEFTKKCTFKERIQNLRIEMGDSQRYKLIKKKGRNFAKQTYQNLRFISNKYFPNLKFLKLFYNAENKYNRQISLLKRERPLLNLEEDFSLDGVNIQTNFRFELRIASYENYNVNIINTKFDGLYLSIFGANHVKVENSQFLNSEQGFSAYGSIQLDIDKISVRNCQSSGVYIGGIRNFKIQNAYIQNCICEGVNVSRSTGKMKNIVIDDCKRTGIEIIYGSNVHYRDIQFLNHTGQRVYVDDGYQNSNQSYFVELD